MCSIKRYVNCKKKLNYVLVVAVTNVMVICPHIYL